MSYFLYFNASARIIFIIVYLFELFFLFLKGIPPSTTGQTSHMYVQAVMYTVCKRGEGFSPCMSSANKTKYVVH